MCRYSLKEYLRRIVLPVLTCKCLVSRTRNGGGEGKQMSLKPVSKKRLEGEVSFLGKEMGAEVFSPDRNPERIWLSDTILTYCTPSNTVSRRL